MMMNFMVYGVGMFAYWLIGFAIQMGGVGAVANLGGTPPLNSEFTITLFGKAFGLWGQNGLFLVHKGTYDVAVLVLFLFQMVFMDTALTIVTGAAAERWKYAAFIISCSPARATLLAKRSRNNVSPVTVLVRPAPPAPTT